MTSTDDRPVTLEPMSSADFLAFVERTIPAYAADKVASGQWSQEQSIDLARKAFDELLPQGFLTPGQHLFNIADGSGARVGTLWFAERDQARQRIAYVYDVLIKTEFQRQGYGRRALRAVEAEARRLKLNGIGLHVFGHNSSARSLYEQLGYRTTNLNMFKSL